MVRDRTDTDRQRSDSNTHFEYYHYAAVHDHGSVHAASHACVYTLHDHAAVHWNLFVSIATASFCAADIYRSPSKYINSTEMSHYDCFIALIDNECS
jgi:hypothetical protein